MSTPNPITGLVATIAFIDVSANFDLGAPAHHNPSIRWNGWCCPYFTFDNALKLCEQLKKMKEMGIGSAEMIYDQAADQFIYTDSDNGDDGETDKYGHTLIDIDGTAIKAYSIGAWAWCWNEDPQAQLNQPV